MILLMSKIYRYNFSKEFLEEAILFSKKSEALDIKHFHEELNKWKIKNEKLITIEYRNLIKYGYDGDFDDKMFKTIRYYLKKKTKHKPKERRKYIPLSREFLDCIDNHINDCKDIKPAVAFKDFSRNYKNYIEKEVLLLEKYLKMDECKDKIKKTYKNRYSKK